MSLEPIDPDRARCLAADGGRSVARHRRARVDTLRVFIKPLESIDGVVDRGSSREVMKTSNNKSEFWTVIEI
jgi:hypothetical protein